jgi:hypothetical protein
MAQVYGGESTYLHEQRQLRLAVVIIVALIVVLVSIIGTVFNALHLGEIITWAVVSVLLIGLVFYKNALKLLEHGASNYTSGIRGERVIADELKKLPDDWHIFRDLKLSDISSNIDFVVLSPGGTLFTIEVKNHHGEIEYDGNKLTCSGRLFEKDVLSQAIMEATSLHDYLLETTGKENFVHPVLVFAHPRARMYFGFNKVSHVNVIQKNYLRPLLTQQDYGNNANIITPELVQLLTPLFQSE